ncbi:methyltransferase domain-containing protein [Mesoterricola sediminis]|uniref:Trans-aconitate 2-methyltransferase n=1 Tax=Mesoterricola sediminis TaxID=2927980 RepID=A0AA48GV65_9BACT|nr:methyltransferase domain-containing protein [Mesoterricola sediminis]BDU76225.1 trans-aconitate 2-methyltransferase [Mesoterricola sediminis]
MSWNPDSYLRFAEPRLRPALDLLARADLTDPGVIVDLGCGTGHLTRRLAERWPQARVTGVDSSAAMLGKAAEGGPGPEWVLADLATWQPAAPVDLLVSNAALQWLPDHGTLLKRLMGHLAPGGVLAVQMPDNYEASSHVRVAEAAALGPWAPRLAHLHGPRPVASRFFYYEVLSPLAAEVDIWGTEYLHVLEGADPVMNWVRGTSLRPYLDALEGAERAAFEAQVTWRLASAYPQRPDGTTLFPFKRLFLVARKAAD